MNTIHFFQQPKMFNDPLQKLSYKLSYFLLICLIYTSPVLTCQIAFHLNAQHGRTFSIVAPTPRYQMLATQGYPIHEKIKMFV